FVVVGQDHANKVGWKHKTQQAKPDNVITPGIRFRIIMSETKQKLCFSCVVGKLVTTRVKQMLQITRNKTQEKHFELIITNLIQNLKKLIYMLKRLVILGFFFIIHKQKFTFCDDGEYGKCSHLYGHGQSLITHILQMVNAIRLAFILQIFLLYINNLNPCCK
ncbi:hypothetical protein ACJX0J_018787, partial [Zea mays]